MNHLTETDKQIIENSLLKIFEDKTGVSVVSYRSFYYQNGYGQLIVDFGSKRKSLIDFAFKNGRYVKSSVVID